MRWRWGAAPAALAPDSLTTLDVARARCCATSFPSFPPRAQDNSWSGVGGTSNCSCGTNYILTGTAASPQCLCPFGYSMAGSGVDAICFPPCAANTYSVVSGSPCLACPANSVSGANARTCTCAANSVYVSGTAGSLVCQPCPSNAVGLGAMNPCTCVGFWDVYDPVANVCITPPSASPSVTPSITPSPSSTISITASNTPTTTVSLSASPTQTPTATRTQTPSSTSTASLSPSVTPVPDVLLSFAFPIKIADGSGALRPSDIAGSVPLMHAIAAGFATLLNVAESQIAIKNVTDVRYSYATPENARGIWATTHDLTRNSFSLPPHATPPQVATGAVIAAVANPAGFTSRRRRLAASGSQGVSVSIVVHLGKT